MVTSKVLKQALRFLFTLLIMMCVAQWMTIKLYLGSIGQKQQLVTEIKSSPLIDLVQTKTGLRLNSFRIASSSKLYGQMIGIPGNPYMVLSSKLNTEFTDTEKEYIVLHEAGHYLLQHTIKEMGVFLLLLITGCVIIRKFSFWTIPLVGIILGFIFIQYATYDEYEADRFAVKHITDPNGMITATEKFKNQNFPPLNDTGLKWKLLYRSTPYQERISIANEEIKLRENKP